MSVAKDRAWDYVVKRGYLTPRQIEEAREFAGRGGMTPAEIRQALVTWIAGEPDKPRRKLLTSALILVDEARHGTNVPIKQDVLDLLREHTEERVG